MIALKYLKVKKNVLLGYWVLVPTLFYFYLFLLSFNQQVEIKQLIVQVPGLALTLLLSFLTLFQAAALYFISSRTEGTSVLMKKFFAFGIIQQILTGNFIGAALCYFVNKNIADGDEQDSMNTKIIFYSMTVFIGVISLVILMIAIRMRGV